jgi:hypothetical protein
MTHTAWILREQTQRVLVTGGRDYDDEAHVFDVLDRLHATARIEVIIAGGKLESEKRSERARGADRLALLWAKARGVTPIECPADWPKYGDRAGPIRNSVMLREHRPTMVVGFPGGHGTADMLRKAAKANVDIVCCERSSHA